MIKKILKAEKIYRESVRMKKYSVTLLILFSAIFFGCRTTKTGARSAAELSAQQLIAENRVEEAKALFDAKADINSADENGNTALHIAAKINDGNLVTFLILKGADTTLKNYNSETALHIAIDNDCYEAARTLALIGNDIFIHDGNNITALEKALAKSDAYYDIMITTHSGKIRDVSGQSIVHYFIKTHNEKALSYCIRKNIPIDVKDENGITPLRLALEDFDNDISVRNAAELLKAGAEPVNGKYSYFEDAVLSRNMSLRISDGQTPLHAAASLGHMAIARYLVANGASVKAQDISGSTPLHSAVRKGNTQIASLLLSNGADVNAPDTLGKTPILLIIPQEKQLETYSLLISNKADTRKKDTYGDTVLHTATLINADPAILSLLVENKADINARNKEGLTPLSTAVKTDRENHIEFYVKNGADINAYDMNKNSPLTMALSKNIRIIKSLVTNANVNSLDSKGNTPLHTAVLKGAPLEAVAYIASICMDIDARNADGNTALYLAIEKRRRDIGELLIGMNADIFASNTKNYSPLRLAFTEGKDSADWIITSKTITAVDGSKNTALHYAAEWGLEDSISTLIEKGADVNVKNANGETPLINAVKTDNTAAIDLLLAYGSFLNTRDNSGSTALHTAVRWNAFNSADDLIKRGIMIDSQNMQGTTPLAEAALSGKKDMALLLLDRGADPNATDAAGRSILINAVRGQNIELIDMMLSAGANPGIQDMDGRNASHEAVLTGNVEIITKIRNSGGSALTRDKNGETPFSLALSKNENVIRAVAGSNKNLADSDGNTLMHIAVQNRARGIIIQTMIYEGYPIDIRNAAGYTPLALAAISDQNSTAGLLLEGGANPFISFNKNDDCTVSVALQKKDSSLLNNIIKYAGERADMQGNTILHYAAKTADVETVKKILSEGLDRTVKNVSGETAYDIAVNWQRKEIAELLK